MIPVAQPLIGEEEKQAVLEVLSSGQLAQGPKVAAFEEAFAEYCGVRFAIATSSGTTALHLALLAHGIGPGDEVITTSFSFIATANAVRYAGARPVFVDIEPHTFNLNPAGIEEVITPRTRAIIPVHLFGLPCDMEPILEIADRHGLVVIEDACQAHGAAVNGRRVGSFGTGCFSFYPTKNMTTAEGGMVTTDDEEVAERLRVIRNHGMRQRYKHEILGYNYRMTDVHAALGLGQLARLEAFNARRRANARYLNQHLRGVVTPWAPEGFYHVFHQYTVRVPDGKRDWLAERLREQGIGTAVYYPIPIHQQPTFRGLENPVGLPETERAAREALSLPVHPALGEEELQRIVEAVNRSLEII